VSAALPELLERLGALEAERDILRTLFRYGHCIDAGDDAGWVDCFTEDGVIDVHYGPERAATARRGLGTRHDVGVRHQGRRALEVFIAGHTHPPAHVHRHVLMAPRIVVTGTTASGTSYLARVDRYAAGPKISSYGVYSDRYREIAAGEWRIAERVVELGGHRPLEVR